jgi:uncharacterized protein YbcI
MPPAAKNLTQSRRSHPESGASWTRESSSVGADATFAGPTLAALLGFLLAPSLARDRRQTDAEFASSLGVHRCGEPKEDAMSTEDANPGLPGEERQALLRDISTQMAAMQKSAFGKGPVGAKSYLFDDLLLIVMREGLTVAEKTMLGFGRQDLVREFRQQFENEMTSRIVGMVEDLTERKVLTYQSQVMFDPDVIVELFVFDRATDGGFVAAEIHDGDAA